MKSKVVRYMDRIKVQRLNPHIFSMDDAGESIGYLVARTITELPLMVINTHGHGDHIYGDIYFEEVYIHPLDMEVARRHSQMDGFMMMMAERGMHMPPFLPIQHGDVIDLGGLTVEVVPHTGEYPVAPAGGSGAVYRGCHQHASVDAVGGKLVSSGFSAGT